VQPMTCNDLPKYCRCAVAALLLLWFFPAFSPARAEDVDKDRWAIGIYRGASPIAMGPAPGAANPVLTAAQVTDVPARFVADPFMIQKGSAWYMLFEVFNRDTRQGDIGLATSPDALSWAYAGIVLDEPFNLSFPCVFAWQDEVYMIPETWQAGAIRLYRAASFPKKWELAAELIQGRFVDPSIFRFNGRWWLFAENNPNANDTLRLYVADHLFGPWTEHPESPVVRGDENIARPGGRVLVTDNQIIRFAQDDTPVYGNQVWGFEITELTPTAYIERAIGRRPVLTGSGIGWNRLGMHHIDPHPVAGKGWIACVDGFTHADEPPP
jgi:hypothetical protein